MKWLAAGALLVLLGVTGCGSQYRPVINPVTPTGPASQPASYVVTISQPGLNAASLPQSKAPCPATDYTNDAIATIIDFSGDSIMATATIGNGPVGFALDSTGSNAYTENCDGTISTIPIETTLQTKNVLSSTLLDTPTSTSNGTDVPPVPINALAISNAQYIVEQGRNAIAAMNGTTSPISLKQEISVAPSAITVTGIPTGQRVYSISQGNSGSGGNLGWGDCATTPQKVTTLGEADAIEVSTNDISAEIPLGVCPVYARTSADGNRTFVLNRGSGTITVINSQLNQLDENQPGQAPQTPQASPYLNNQATINLCSATNPTAPCGAGPVYAALYTTGNLLVTSNYDNNTISIINVALDVYGNDGPNFGQVLATVPVGANPAAVTILQDGTRAYVANEGDGTVSVVNLGTEQNQKTIALGTDNPSPRTIVSTYNQPIGKVYVSSQASPYLTVIRTDTDVIDTAILTGGNIVDVRTTQQYAGSTSNNLTQSRSVGSGAP